MEIVRFRWLLATVTMMSLAGCTDAIEQINPTEPRIGARRFPTPHPPPAPRLRVASQPEIYLQMDDYSTTGDHVVIHNHSDGALYDLKVIANHDYAYVMPVLQMGETVRVPDSYLRTEAGRGFPTDRDVRVDRVEVVYQGRMLALFDRRARATGSAPSQ